MITMTQVAQHIFSILALLAIVWICIEWFAPNYRNYILGLWQFYILENYRNPLHFKLYQELEDQLKNLEASGKRKYEQKLVKLILQESGKYKAKMTGKCKNKVRFKVYKGGKKITNFR